MKKQQFLTQLKTLVGFETLPENSSEINNALEYASSLIHPKAKVKLITEFEAPILLASNTDSKSPEYGYLVHVDVVSAPHHMFEMREDAENVYGRGVSDMKFSIPIGISLLNSLLENPHAPSFSLAITSDEEVGGFRGAYNLAHTYNWRPKTLIVPDGGDNLKFAKASKGVLQLSITSKGKSAHASRPWIGSNAITPLSKLLVELDKKFGKSLSTETWDTTMNVGYIRGGISVNQVCDEAEVKLDFRYPETESMEQLESFVRKICKKVDPALEIKKIASGLPTFTNPDLPIVQRFLSELENKYAHPIEISPNYGASDARHFAEFNTPILMIKPVGGDIHCNTEWINIESCLKFADALESFVRTPLSSAELSSLE